MQINLKQTEITEALQQYIAQKGIDLRGKTVDIAFTAGRKEGGLTAEINIEDQDIPGFFSDEDHPALALVPAAEPVAQPEPEVTAVAEQEYPAEAKTTSLFN